VAAGAVDALDTRVLHGFASARTPWWNDFFLSVTSLGSFAVLLFMTLAYSAGMTLARRYGEAIALPVAVIGGALLSSGLKLLVGRMRPPLEIGLYDARGHSFPSGHTISAFAFWVAIALLAGSHIKQRTVRRFALAYALFLGVLVGLSRVYLGVHYLSDVIGGALVGTGWSVTVILAERTWRHRGHTPVEDGT
jgi:undecaprenyl-diphosphatase